MDDTRAGLPETNVILGAGGGQEVINFLVDTDSSCQIFATTDLGFNQMVTVNCGWVGYLIHAGGHELEDSHLRSSILAGDAIGAKLEVGLATLDFLTVRVIKVRVENLLGISQRPVETAADDGQVLRHLLVVDEVVLFPVVLANLQHDDRLARFSRCKESSSAFSLKITCLSVEGRVRDGSQASDASRHSAGGATPDDAAQNLPGREHDGPIEGEERVYVLQTSEAFHS